MEYSKEIAQLNEQVIQLIEKVNSLQVLYEQVNSQSQHWQNMFLTSVGIVLTIVGILASVGIFQMVKSMVGSKMDEEIKRRGDKANIRKPEFISSIGIVSEEGKNDEVRIVKLEGKPIVNFQSNENNLKLTLNNKMIEVRDSYKTLFVPAPGWSLLLDLTVYNNLIVDLNIIELRNYEPYRETMTCYGWTKIAEGPKDAVYWPNNCVYFDGYSDEDPLNTNIKFKIDNNGYIYMIGSVGTNAESIRGNCVYIKEMG